MRLAISQPTYLPWLGYFDLIDQTDCFVVLDNVQFSRQSWQQRNRIKSAAGLQWLTVPVAFRGKLGQPICEVQIREEKFSKDHLRAIELAYRRAPYFSQYFAELTDHLLSVREGSLLADLNVRLLRWLVSTLDIRTPMILASSLPVEGKRTDLLASVCRNQSADSYISPLGASVYLLNELEVMARAGVDVAFQNYQHPEYEQLFPPFVPYASVLDLLFNEGPRSLEIIRSGRREPLSPEQVAEKSAESQVPS